MFVDLNRSNRFVENTENTSSELASSWLPPEVQERPGIYSRKTDIWYLGIVFLEMFWGVEVTNEFENFDTFSNTASGELPAVANAFVKRILDSDPKKRPTAIELMNDPFLNDADPSLSSDRPSKPSMEINGKSMIRSFLHFF